ncbi:MAG: tyrosine-type recombinase/integrase [Cyclobacteriaceae bacterium]
MEARSLWIKDVDFERNMIHVRQGKGRKDRYVPIGVNLSRGLKTYLEAVCPKKWLFNLQWQRSPGRVLSKRRAMGGA